MNILRWAAEARRLHSALKGPAELALEYALDRDRCWVWRASSSALGETVSVNRDTPESACAALLEELHSRIARRAAALREELERLERAQASTLRLVRGTGAP